MITRRRNPAPLRDGCRASKLVNVGWIDGSEDTRSHPVLQPLPPGLDPKSIIAAHWFGWVGSKGKDAA